VPAAAVNGRRRRAALLLEERDGEEREGRPAWLCLALSPKLAFPLFLLILLASYLSGLTWASISLPLNTNNNNNIS
jgi:hypothetical protein